MESGKHDAEIDGTKKVWKRYFPEEAKKRILHLSFLDPPDTDDDGEEGPIKKGC